MAERNSLTVYSRRGCPACEDMIAELEFTPLGETLDLRVVDVDTDPDLVREYGWHVPVLLLNDVEVCRHTLDLDALRAQLARHR